MSLKIMRIFDVVECYVVFDTELDVICTTFDSLDIEVEEAFPDAVFDPINVFHMGSSKILTSYEMSVELTDLLLICKDKILESNPPSTFDALSTMLVNIK